MPEESAEPKTEYLADTFVNAVKGNYYETLSGEIIEVSDIDFPNSIAGKKDASLVGYRINPDTGKRYDDIPIIPIKFLLSFRGIYGCFRSVPSEIFERIKSARQSKLEQQAQESQEPSTPEDYRGGVFSEPPTPEMMKQLREE